MEPLVAYQLAQLLNAALPADMCLWLAEQLAERHWRRAASDRRAVQENLATILNQPVAEHSPLVREVFRNFARYLEEFIRAPRLLSSGRLVVEGEEAVVDLLRAHGGCLVLSTHLGNWELGGMLIRRMGFPLSAVFLPHEDPEVNRFFDAQRLRCGVGVVPLGVGATPACLERLRAGQPVAIMSDREFGTNGIRVQLFGRPAWLPRGPAVLSLRTGAPAIPTVLVRQAPWRFRFYTEPPIWPSEVSSSQPTERIQVLTQRYARALERAIGLDPTQWLMFRPFEDRGPWIVDRGSRITNHESRFTASIEQSP